MLRVEQLESRDNASVSIFYGVVAPSPQGDPGFTAKFLVGDPQHSPGHEVIAHGRQDWDYLFVGA